MATCTTCHQVVSDVDRLGLCATCAEVWGEPGEDVISKGDTVVFIRAAQLPANARTLIKVGTRARVLGLTDSRVRFMVLGDGRRTRAGVVAASYLARVAE